MDNAIKPNEPEATASMPMLPEPALPGGFALVIEHFISEIADCTQQQKTVPRQPPSRQPRLRFAPSVRALIKIDFCGVKRGIIETSIILCYTVCVVSEENKSGDRKQKEWRI